MDPIVNDSGTVANSGTPGTDPQDGQSAGQVPGGEASAAPTTPDLGGFKSVEELINDHKNLLSLKGKLGNEVGTLRSEIAKYQGKFEALEQMRTQTPAQTVSMDTLNSQLDKGEISLGQYISERDKIVKADLNREVEEKLTGLQKKTEREKNIERFVASNPGYVPAFEEGKLSKWIDKGYSGEVAWDKYNLENLNTENSTLKSQLASTNEKLRLAEAKLGIKIDQGKDGTGKVLGGNALPGGSFNAGPAAPGVRLSRAEQIQRGMNIINAT